RRRDRRRSPAREHGGGYLGAPGRRCVRPVARTQREGEKPLQQGTRREQGVDRTPKVSDQTRASGRHSAGGVDESAVARGNSTQSAGGHGQGAGGLNKTNAMKTEIEQRNQLLAITKSPVRGDRITAKENCLSPLR